jgi:uncharacterized membrane protein YkvA (DUF1232 family)
MFFSKNSTQPNDSDYSGVFSVSGFWRVVGKLTKRSSRKVLSTALTLYYCLRDPSTPKWAKTVIVGALGYLIFPMDFIPDAILGMGFTDDWGVIIAAMTSVIRHVKDEHKEKAGTKADRMLGISDSQEA